MRHQHYDHHHPMSTRAEKIFTDQQGTPLPKNHQVNQQRKTNQPERGTQAEVGMRYALHCGGLEG
jgi:hypothetical protein